MEIVSLVLLVAAMGAAWWWLGRRRKQLLGDSDDPASLLPDAEPGEPEVFTRDALVNRSRAFDPGGWDDSPDAATAPAEGPSTDGPATPPSTYLDRELLERRNRPAPPTPPPPAPAEDDEEPPAYLDREYLERRTKPAPAPVLPDDDEGLPTYFDRDYLERKAKRPASEDPEPEA